eukprot:2821242-Pyramimonas_sp.AAC.1
MTAVTKLRDRPETSMCKRRRAHSGPHFLGTRALLCHAIAKWRDRPRARNSKKDDVHIEVSTFWGPMLCHAMLWHSGGRGLGQVTVKDAAHIGAPTVWGPMPCYDMV